MKTPVLFNWSTGKDSSISLYELLQDKRYDVAALLTTITREYKRVSMHGVQEELVLRQAESFEIPLEIVYIPRNATNEEYDNAMRKVLLGYREEGVFSVASGDIYLEEVRQYRVEKLASVGMDALFPVWGRESKEIAHEFIDLGFKAIVTCVDTEMLSEEFSGKEFDKDFLKDLPEEVDPCGENGEFHTFCYDGPIFKQPVHITKGDVVLRNERYMFCDIY
ncbi:diphthine--ammonia ligase [Planctomycetota bacterium]